MRASKNKNFVYSEIVLPRMWKLASFLSPTLLGAMWISGLIGSTLWNRMAVTGDRGGGTAIK